jgi:autotransporter-associated beta strand protein
VRREYSWPGVLTLGGTANTFAGNLTINDGTVRLGVSGKLPAATPTTVNSGRTLDLNGFNQTLSVVTMQQGGSTVLTGAGTLWLLTSQTRLTMGAT